MDHTDELIEHQGARAAEGALEGTPAVEEVLTGDEDDGIEILEVRQEVRGIPAINMGREEAPEEDAGETRPPSKEEDPQQDRVSTADHMNKKRQKKRP